MDSLWRCLFATVFLGFITLCSGANETRRNITCYQCATTKFDSPCYDYEALTNTSRGLDIKFRKNCLNSNDRWDRCVTERHMGSNGQLMFFHRGCHDGKTFNVKSSEFKNLKANNATTCAYVDKMMVCFTFCDSGDFCNGPQPVYDKCDKEYYKNKNISISDYAHCGGNRIHDNGLAKLLSTIVMFLVIWGAIHSHRLTMAL